MIPGVRARLCGVSASPHRGTRPDQNLIRLAAGALAFLLAAEAAPAQTTPRTVGAGAVVEGYAFGDAEAIGLDALRLVTTPFAARIGLHRRLDVSVGGAWASASLDRSDGTSAELSGLTDTSIRADLRLGRDRFTLSAAAYLPTGTTGHTEAESLVAGAVASDLLPFRISNWGTGGGADVSLAAALPAGPVGLGVRVGYRTLSEYEPLAAPLGGTSAFAYDPGDQLYVRLAADRNLSAGGTLSLTATWQTFGDDLAGGAPLFAAGDRIQLLGSYLAPWGSGNAFGYAGVLHRADGAFLDPGNPTGGLAQDLVLAGAGARVIRGGLVLLPAADLRILRTTEGDGAGYTLGLGGSVEVPFGGAGRVVPTARVRYGSVTVRDRVGSDYVGYEVGVSLRGVGQ